MKKSSSINPISSATGSNSTAPGQVRIIAGQWRGRKLPVLNLTGLRPTSDRMRETLFNWLIPYLPQAKVLDLFAGSGALGFEAASRYAHHVDLVENDAHAAASLKNTLRQLTSSALHVYHTDAFLFLKKNTNLYDIIFIDPPFHKGFAEKVLPLMETHLNERGIIYLECENDWFSPELNRWVILKEKKMGMSTARLLQRISNN